jgi:translation initiation factor IF-3
LKVNRDIRAEEVRVIDEKGQQVGVLDTRDALRRAQDVGLDLIEIAPKAKPPVCRIMDYSKYRYQMAKKEKENKKAQHHVKIKEVKLKPNIDVHDLNTKIKKARNFILKGNKVRVTCFFRGREMLHLDLGEKVIKKFISDLEEIVQVEVPLKQLGRMMVTVLAPISKEAAKKLKLKQQAKGEAANGKDEN